MNSGTNNRMQRNKIKEKTAVNSFTFAVYILFVFEFFMHLSSRYSFIGVLRPTIIFVLLLTALLFSQKDIFKHREKNTIFSALNILIIYLVISLPMVEFPGSVLRVNLAIFVKAIAFFYFTALIIDTHKRLVLFLKVFVFTQIFRVFEPLFIYLTTGYLGGSTHVGRGEFAGRLGGAPADVINANELGFVIVTVIPFLHYFLLSRDFKSKILYFMLLIPLLYALLLTMSRGSFLALLVGGALLFKKSKNKFILIILTSCLAIAGWSQLGDFQKDRYLALVGLAKQENNAATAEGRINGIMHEFELGFSRPIVGHGIGTTPEAKTHKWGKRQASHNMYGELLIEIGIIGFIFFIQYIWAMRQNLLGLRSQFTDEDKKNQIFYFQLNNALLMMMIMYAFYSLNYWGLSQYYWYLFGGLIVAVTRLQNIEIKRNMREDSLLH
jgi:putative inorganic carbon (HCO3(-)) transporter